MFTNYLSKSRIRSDSSITETSMILKDFSQSIKLLINCSKLEISELNPKIPEAFNEVPSLPEGRFNTPALEAVGAATDDFDPQYIQNSLPASIFLPQLVQNVSTTVNTVPALPTELAELVTNEAFFLEKFVWKI